MLLNSKETIVFDFVVRFERFAFCINFIGNSFGTAPNGQVCKGCGPQEQFYGCADIAISPATSGAHQAGSYHPYVPQGVVARPQLPVGGSSITCTATTAFRRISPWSADSWCVSNCRMGNCPPMYCNTPCQSLRVLGQFFQGF